MENAWPRQSQGLNIALFVYENVIREKMLMHKDSQGHTAIRICFRHLRILLFLFALFFNWYCLKPMQITLHMSTPP